MQTIQQNTLNDFVKNIYTKKIKTSTKPPIIFSQNIKNQIIGTDLVFGLYCTLKDSPNLSKNSKRCIKRIENRIKNIKRIICNGKTLVLTSKDHKKYSQIIKNIQSLIQSVDLDLDYFNAVLMIVEDIRVSAKKSKNKTLYKEWLLLSQSLNTLYSHLDPELSKIEFMKLGENLGKRIYKIYQV